MSEWRYIAQHPTTGEFLDFDLPLSAVVLTRRLSGPWGMQATVDPESSRLLNADGSRLLDEWAVQVWAECDGVIRGGGILTSSTIAGTSWALTFDGHLRYPYGIPYTGSFARTRFDPLDAVREIWGHVQGHPDGNLGLVVDQVDTGGEVKLGIPAAAAYFEVSFSAEGTESADMVWVREDSVPKSQIEASATGKLATASGRLDADIGENITSLTLKDASDFDALDLPYTVRIGSEYLRVRARSGRNLNQLIRGYDPDTGESKDGQKAAHSKDATVTYAGIGKIDDSLTLKDGSKFQGVGTPFTIKIGSEAIRVRERNGRVLSRLIRGWDAKKREPKDGNRDPHAAGAAVSYAGTPRRKVDRVAADPYQLAWWDNVDCGDELETLAKETPFDFVEEHAWDGDTIRHRLRLGYPRIGRLRDDLAFVEGENLAAIPSLERDGETFAQYVLGLGAGEGRKRRRTPMIGSPDGRLRRPFVLERPDVGNEDRLRRLAAAEQRTRRRLGSIPDVILSDHPNAPLGSWSLGDSVPVTLGYGWARETVVCRIVEETVTPGSEGRAVALKLSRADGL